MSIEKLHAALLYNRFLIARDLESDCPTDPMISEKAGRCAVSESELLRYGVSAHELAGFCENGLPHNLDDGEKYYDLNACIEWCERIMDATRDTQVWNEGVRVKKR